MNTDDPRHGTRAGYIAGCRDTCCSTANRRWIKQYRLAASRNGGRTTVPTEPVREHVRNLQRTMSLSAIGNAARVTSSQMVRLMRGDHPTMRAATATRLLAVRPDTKVGGHYISAVGSRRRLQALVAIGYSFERIEKHLGGYGRSNMRILAYENRPWITSDVALRIKAAFDELSMKLPDAPTRVHQGAITKARNRAKARGWVPPLAWDEDTIDDPNAKPAGLTAPARVSEDIDEAAVLRRMNGERVHLTKYESAEVVRRLRAAGWSYLQIQTHAGLRTDRYVRTNTKQEAAA
jgi:hypothetical protein